MLWHVWLQIFISASHSSMSEKNKLFRFCPEYVTLYILHCCVSDIKNRQCLLVFHLFYTYFNRWIPSDNLIRQHTLKFANVILYIFAVLIPSDFLIDLQLIYYRTQNNYNCNYDFGVSFSLESRLQTKVYEKV